MAYEPELNAKGERLIWIEDAMADRLGAMRGPGESYSDVILQIVEGEAHTLSQTALHGAHRLIESQPHIGCPARQPPPPRRMRRPVTRKSVIAGVMGPDEARWAS